MKLLKFASFCLETTSIYIILLPEKSPHIHTHVCVVVAQNDVKFQLMASFWPKEYFKQ